MNGPSLLKAWRTEKGLSQEAAAEKVPVHQNTWSDWESGQKTPTAHRVIKLAVVTEGACPVDAWAEDDETRDALRALMRAAATTDADAA